MHHSIRYRSTGRQTLFGCQKMLRILSKNLAKRIRRKKTTQHPTSETNSDWALQPQNVYPASFSLAIFRKYTWTAAQILQHYLIDIGRLKRKKINIQIYQNGILSVLNELISTNKSMLRDGLFNSPFLCLTDGAPSVHTHTVIRPTTRLHFERQNLTDTRGYHWLQHAALLSV